MAQGDAKTPLVGTMVGRYRVERCIGQGGMGEVYELVQPAIHKRMALKVLHEEFVAHKDVVGRFFDEARAVNLIAHPNIIDIADFGHLGDGRPFMVMEYLEGESLEDFLEREGPMPVEGAVDLFQQVCSAVGAAHAQGIVHRDLKPENVHLHRISEGTLRIKVLDFGVAKLRDRTGAATATGVVLGTPTYMSPEQAEGRTHSADHRSDIYSLGVLLFRMLSGRPPFQGETLGELLVKHIHQVPPNISELRPDLDSRWNAVLLKALAKEPDRRYASVAAFEEAVKRESSVQKGASGASDVLTRTTGPKIRHVLFAIGGLVAVSLVVWFWGGVAGTSEPAASGPRLVGRVADAAPSMLLDASATSTNDTAPAAETHADAGPRAPSETGILVVTADPFADVYVDGKRVGQTPLRLPLEVGRYRVRLVQPASGTEHTEPVRVRRNTTSRVHRRW